MKPSNKMNAQIRNSQSAIRNLIFLLPFKPGRRNPDLKTGIVFALVGIAFFLLTCSKDSSNNSTKTITVSGTITLEGQTDHSGVTVSLYRPVTLDAELVAVNQEYPQIGVQISQETEFDHREQTAVYSATTNAAGSWSIGNVKQDIYNDVGKG